MQHVLGRVQFLFALIILSACADLPTTPQVMVSEQGPNYLCDTMVDGVYVMCPVNPTIPGPPPPSCDPWTSPDWCAGDGEPCITSAVDDPEYLAVTGCLPGGGGPGGGATTCPTWDPTCSADPPDGGDDSGAGQPPPTPYAEGPLLWAACVLAVVGSTYTVDVVGSKFVAWYDAHRALVHAERALNAAYEMMRDGYEFDPDAVRLLEFRVELAEQRRNDAVGAVEEATGVSVLTLLGAGFACGAAIAAPTP
jgi:hypothetical protein